MPLANFISLLSESNFLNLKKRKKFVHSRSNVDILAHKGIKAEVVKSKTYFTDAGS